jgi:uncharacterized protein (TIGR02996 family)
VNEATLLEAIGEAPNDDGPRLVYADWLQQQTDRVARARGEYISLACTTARDPERAKKRMAELLTKYEAKWLGPVADLIDPAGTHWARGFLDHVILELRGKSVAPALGLAAWYGMRTITSQGHEYRDDRQRRVHASLRDVLTQPALANLRGLYIHESVIFDMPEWANAPRITELAIAPLGDTPNIKVLRAACFSKVRRLHLFGCAPALACKLARSDLTMIVVDEPDVLRSWLATLASQRAIFEEVRIVSGVYLQLARLGVELVVRLDPNMRWSALEVRWGELDEVRLRSRVIAELGQLPEASITHLSFVGPPTKKFDVARFKQRVTDALRARSPDLQVG